MSEEKFSVDNKEYKNVDDFIKNGLYIENTRNFKKYEEIMLKNNYCGFYIISATLENNNILRHTFIFIDKHYDNLILHPIEIPEINMFNTRKSITKLEYQYIKFNKLDYQTKHGEIVDFKGNIRKKEKEEKSVNVDQINFLIQPSAGYDLKKIYKNTISINFNLFSEEYLNLMRKHYYHGIYEITLILKTSEHINLYFKPVGKDKNNIKLQPYEYNHERNLFNIPQEYILYKNFKFYSYSIKNDFLSGYSNHMYEKYNKGDFICVATYNFSNEILTAIKEFGNKGKLIYTFKTNINEQEYIKSEVYKFIKFKKSYQWNQNYVILESIELPEKPWHETDLKDITCEKWEYIIC